MRRLFGLLIVLFTLVLAGCSSSATALPPMPTNTPMPTFTPTPPLVATPVDPAAAAAARTAEAQQAQTNAGQQNTGDRQAEAPPPPTDTPLPPPAQPVATVKTLMNVRGGPGTGYNIIGMADPGQRFVITGKNPQGDWWQVDFNGQTGWLFGQLVTSENTGDVAVVANIPPPPPPTNTPIPPPTNTPVPAQPTPTPAPKYKFNIALVQACNRQPAGTWFAGTTYVNGQPANGYKVVFSTAPDGSWATQPVTSGPHPGYEAWNPGYYSHIISAPANGPVAGRWYVWIVDDNGNRISEIAEWTSTGPGEGCNEAVIDFDSR